MKIKLISRAVAAHCALLAVMPVHAEKSAGPIEQVLVTVPIHKNSLETIFPIDALSGEALSREAASTLGETLANLSGVHNASFGPGVGQPVIRGLQGPRVKVLLNGNQSADVSSLSADHAVAVEPLLADSIEVLRGPATLLYGGGAIGGVVNVVDSRVPRTANDDAEVDLEYRFEGANNAHVGVIRADGSVPAGDNALAWHADATYRDGDNTTVPKPFGSEAGDLLDNTFSRADAYTIGGSYVFDDGYIGIATSRLTNNYGLPSGVHSEHEEEHGEDEHLEDGHDHEEDMEEDHSHEGIRLDMEQTRHDLMFSVASPFAGLDEIRGIVTKTDYQHAEIEEGGAIGTVYSNDSIEGRLELVHAPILGSHGVVGVHAAESDFSAVGEEAFVVPTTSERFGLFVVEDWHWSDVKLEAGVRYDRDELHPEFGFSHAFDALSGSFGAVYEFVEDWHLRASITRAERAPSAEELYSNYGNDDSNLVAHAATQAFEIGNENLDTERSWNYEAGVDWHSDKHRVSVAVFYNDFESYINVANTGEMHDGLPVREYQQSGALFHGVEVDSEWLLTSTDEADLRLRLAFDMVRGELDGGSDIPRLPPARGIVGLTWSSNSMDLYTKATIAADQNRAGEFEEPTDGYVRWDLGADWHLGVVAEGEMDLHLGLDNLLDEEIRLSTSYLREIAPEPGRAINLGVRWSF